MKTKNLLKKYSFMKMGLWLIASLSFLAMLGGCGAASNEATASGAASQANISRKNIKPGNNPIPDEDTDISPESKKRGKISLSKDKKTIFAQGWLETHELADRRTKKATKIVFRKDARILVDWNMDSFCPPHLQDAPLVKEIEVEEGNPFLYEIDGMLIQRAGADFDFEYTTDRETLILCVPGKKGEIRIPEGVQDIYTSAFYGCSGISSVFLPSSLYVVGDAAFGGMKSCTSIQSQKNKKGFFTKNGVLYLHYSNSSSILIAYPAGKTDKIFKNAPKNTAFVSAGAFLEATQLQEVYLPSGMKTINDGAFWGCKNLKKVIVNNKKRINVAGDAFFGCPKLKEYVTDKHDYL